MYAASQVLVVYEKKYPKDARPRKAIGAARKYIKNPTKKNADAAYAAADAAYAAYVAADVAAYVAYAAAYAAYAAADAAYAAADVAYAADAKKIKTKILRYGFKLLTIKERL